jgi:hypothetical protein
MKAETIVWGAALASSAAAWIGLLISAISLSTSRRAIRITERQEERREPLLIPELRNGHFRTNPDGSARLYAFLIAVSNRSDTDNAIAHLELRLTYAVREGVDVTVKLPADTALPKGASQGAETRLAVPSSIGAHQTVSGWCFFRVERSILERPNTIQRYLIAVIDSHGIEATLEPIIVQEYRSEMGTPEMEPSKAVDHR